MCGQLIRQSSRHDFTLYLRHFFRHPNMGGGISVRNFTVIDYMMRRADRMFESMFENDSVKNIQLPPAVRDEMYELWLGYRWLPRNHGKRPQ